MTLLNETFRLLFFKKRLLWTSLWRVKRIENKKYGLKKNYGKVVQENNDRNELS